MTTTLSATPMTFEDFQATGRDSTDIGNEIHDPSLEGALGRIYYSNLYIEHWVDDRFGIAPANGPTWTMTLENTQPEGKLAEMEAILFAWAVANDYFDAAAA